MRDNNIRQLDFHKDAGTFIYIIQPLIKYFEDLSVEDLQINEFEAVTLIKRGGKVEFIKDEGITKRLVNNLMLFTGVRAKKNFIYGDTYIKDMLPINKFRFTALVDTNVHSGVKISIRLNDNVLYHSYKDFNISELEFNFLVKNICEQKSSCFIIGEVGSGKTAFNNLLIDKISNNEVINVVGDINELIFREEQHTSEITVTNEAEYKTAFDILTRSNPHRIIIPELTTDNGNLILRAMNTGTKGFMLTMHAGSNDKSVAEAFADNAKLSGQETTSVEELHKKINSNVDFFIYLNKNDKGQRYISKVTINNKIIEQEARELNILGFSKPQLLTKPKSTPKAKQVLSFNKLIKKYKQGVSVRALAQEFGISKSTIYEMFKTIKEKTI